MLHASSTTELISPWSKVSAELTVSCRNEPRGARSLTGANAGFAAETQLRIVDARQCLDCPANWTTSTWFLPRSGRAGCTIDAPSMHLSGRGMLFRGWSLICTYLWYCIVQYKYLVMSSCYHGTHLFLLSLFPLPVYTRVGVEGLFEER